MGATRAAASLPFAALAPRFPDDAPSRGPVELICATARDLQAKGGRRRVVVAVDDAHLLDDASSTLIANLATAGVAFAIMTASSGEPVPDVLLRLCKESDVFKVELSPLPDPMIDRLIDHGAPSELDARQRRRLRRRAQGNPLALRKLLHGCIPGGLSDLILSRMDGLLPADRGDGQGARRVADDVPRRPYSTTGRELTLSCSRPSVGRDEQVVVLIGRTGVHRYRAYGSDLAGMGLLANTSQRGSVDLH